MKILLETHKELSKNNFVFDVPIDVENRTMQYIEKSCTILEWLKENYIFTGNKKDYCTISDIYKNFKHSKHFDTLSREEKRKLTRTYFADYIKQNIKLKEFFMERYKDAYCVLKQWTHRDYNDDELIIYFFYTCLI